MQVLFNYKPYRPELHKLSLYIRQLCVQLIFPTSRTKKDNVGIQAGFGVYSNLKHEKRIICVITLALCNKVNAFLYIVVILHL